jgi:hypothetical protein
MTTTTTTTTTTLRREPIRVSTLEVARRMANAYTKPHWMVYGDDGKVWLVVPRDFEVLVKAGFKPAK